MPKIIQTAETHEIDHKTGEVITSTESQTQVWEDEPAYVKLYLDDICYLNDIPKTCSKVLRELLRHVSYADPEGGMIIQPTGYVRKLIMKSLGYTNSQSLTNALTALVKGKVLFKLEGGAYRLNPYLFGRGKWIDIARLRTQITYDLKGRTIDTEIEMGTKVTTNQEDTPPIVRKPIIFSPEERDQLELIV